MAKRQTSHALGQFPMPNPKGSEIVGVRMLYDSAKHGNVILNDIIEFGFLPEDCVPVDWILDTSDLDSGGPTIVLSVGILNAAGDDISTAAADGGAAWASGLTTAQAGGMVRPTTRPTMLVTPTAAKRSVGVKVTTAATTFQAGTMGLTLFYRAADHGQ